jgi:hypothetical protein
MREVIFSYDFFNIAFAKVDSESFGHLYGYRGIDSQPIAFLDQRVICRSSVDSFKYLHNFRHGHRVFCRNGCCERMAGSIRSKSRANRNYVVNVDQVTFGMGPNSKMLPRQDPIVKKIG